MTFKEARDKLRAVYRMTLKLTPDHEFRVNFVGGKEATAYYAADLDDAFTTAIDMRLRRPLKQDGVMLSANAECRERAIDRLARAGARND